MTKKTTEQTTVTNEVLETLLEKAPEQKKFVESDYFKGLCEIASACMTKRIIYVPCESKGIFNSLFFKRIFAKAETKDNGYIVGQFETKNRYLFNYDVITREYTTEKENNMQVFIETVKNLNENKTPFTVFNLEPVQAHQLELDELIK